MLPKGSGDGKTYQFLFFIDRYEHKVVIDSQADFLENIPRDDVRFDYPLNRVLKFEKILETLPNARFHEVKIYFKDMYDLKLPGI